MAAASELRQLMVRLSIYLVLFLIHFGQSAGSGKDAVPTSGCVCPGDTLSYECTVMEGLAIVWTGSALDCPLTNNGIVFYSHFDAGTYRTCNNGAIVARGLSVEGNSYTSQFNVTITPDTAGKTIECVHYNWTQDILIFTLIIPAITGPFLTPTTLGISNLDLSLKQLTFSWSPVTLDCPATIHYNILASNCGSCPTTTNHTNVTCTDIPANKECNFAIQTVVCGNITGNFSNPISINTNIFYSNTAYIASISSLATFSVVSMSALLIVIVIILVRSRIKIKAALDSQGTNRAVSSPQMQSIYEDPVPSVSVIKTRDNIAYVHTKITTT